MSTYRRDLDEGQQGEARAWQQQKGLGVTCTLLCEPDGCDRKEISKMIHFGNITEMLDMFQDPFGNFANFPTLLQPYLSPIYTKDNNYKVLVITLIL